jgi:hypothetical protein
MIRRRHIRRFTGPRPVLQPYSYLGCPETVARVPWCYRICKPINGLGTCGRVAPHTLLGRVQRAIARYQAEHPQPAPPA